MNKIMAAIGSRVKMSEGFQDATKQPIKRLFDLYQNDRVADLAQKQLWRLSRVQSPPSPQHAAGSKDAAGSIQDPCIGREIMNRRSAVFAIALGLAFVSAPSLGLAAEDHVAEAISHTKEAITQGKAGHADQLVVHAKVGLTHAEAAEKAKPNPHVAEGITHLKAAIEHGEMGHADVGTTHAEEALKHLEMAK